MIMVIRFLVFWLIFGGLHAIESRVEPFSSNYEDLELEAQLKILNKSPIQSFEKEDGSTIDCIDIYKQPAFDHPLLKNHKLQMKPSLLLQEKMVMPTLELKEEDDINLSNSKSKSKFPGCPSGTVPIRRTQKEDLIRANLPSRHNPPMANALPSHVTAPQGVHHAGISTPQGATEQYLGARLALTVHNLTMTIPEQISTASARVGTGVAAPFSSIEFGWTADGYEKTGCFNMLCPGFVQVCQQCILGQAITDFTECGKELKYLYFAITKDPKTLNWWLVQSVPQAADVWVGYWPKELFHNSFEFATNVQIGGKVFSPSLEPAKTPMGSGHFVPGDSLKTASADFRLVDTSFGFTSDPKMVVVTDMPDSYQAQYLNGTNVIFGGPDIQKSQVELGYSSMEEWACAWLDNPIHLSWTHSWQSP
ncbi:hypothetical protein Cgig2_030002 [Carnegiea gigantea]|uniref:Neprosin PEP catalytic domain-containing protein n=1 Tax=Carnegiea gigantea TaxID=171969 RepID=A0A9Q1K7Y9_9CARY|nr:hypothetical protein Cgig2_030002 [Carnegiea gigantea]